MTLHGLYCVFYKLYLNTVIGTFILNSAFHLILMEEETSEIGIRCAFSDQYLFRTSFTVTVQIKITAGFRILLPSSRLSQLELIARDGKKTCLDIESNSMHNICCHLCIF